MNKTSIGIIFTVFGSNQSQVSLGLAVLQEAAKQRFNLPVRLAFTSDSMRQRLAIERKKSDSLSKAIQKMAFEQFKTIVVQPLQVIPGLEYHELAHTIAEFQSPKLKLALGQPLLRLHPDCSAEPEPLLNTENGRLNTDLTRPENCPTHATKTSLNRLAHALHACIPPLRQPEELVLFMGHGSKHKAQACYVDLLHTLQNLDKNCAVGTISGALPLQILLEQLKSQQPTQAQILTQAQRQAQPQQPTQAQIPAQFSSKNPKIWLIPLLASVGKHTLEDMVHGKNSWQNQLEAQGYEVCPMIRGLSEHPSVVKVWLDNVAEALEKLA